MSKSKPSPSPAFGKRAVFPLLAAAALGGLILAAASDNAGTADLDGEGRRVFHRELKKEFLLHPASFSLRPEDRERILTAETRIPGLDRAVLRLLFLERADEMPGKPASDTAGRDPEFREGWLRLCRVGAARFVKSLFLKEEPAADGGASALDLALAGLGLGPSPRTGEKASPTPEWALRAAKVGAAHKIGRGAGVKILVIGPSTRGESGYLPCEGTPWTIELPDPRADLDYSPAASAAAAVAPEAEVRFRPIFHHPGSPYQYWSALQAALAVREAAASGVRVAVIAAAFNREYACLRDACEEAFFGGMVIVGPNGPGAGGDLETPGCFPAHWTDVLAVAPVVPGRGGRPVPLVPAASHFTDLAAPAWAAGGAADPTTAAGMCGGAAALISGLMPPVEDELQGQYFQRIREILVHAADSSIQGRDFFNPVTGYGLLDAGRAVGDELETYQAHRRQIDENFKKRMKERAEAEEEAAKAREEAEAGRKEEKR